MRLLVAIAEAGSVSEAAESQHVSQPAASRAIAELEQALGDRLFERLSRGVRLTPLGRAFADRAASIVRQTDAAEREFSDLRDGRRGAVAVGAVSGAALKIVAPAIDRARAAMPFVEFTVRVDTSAVLARDLAAAELDFVFARPTEDLDRAAFEAKTIGVEEARLLARRGHRLVRRRPSLAELAACDWILQPRGAPLARALEAMFNDSGVPPPQAFLRTASVHLTLASLARSNAIAAMSAEAAFLAARIGGNDGFEILPTPTPLIVHPYSLIVPRERALSPAARQFLAISKSVTDPRHGGE